jgi:hypothetical protein
MFVFIDGADRWWCVAVVEVPVEEEIGFGDAVLAAAAGLPTERLEEELRTAAGHLNAVTCRFLLFVAEYDARKGWESWEVASCAHWIMWRCGVAPSTAREQVCVARRLVELPLVREAFARGELSYSKVRAVVRMATERSEKDLVDLAKSCTAAHLVRVAAQYARLEKQDRADPDAEARFGLWWHSEEDGAVVLTTRMRPEDFEAFRILLDARTAPPNRAEGEAGQTIAERRADALIALAGDAAASPEGGAEGVSAEVVVHVDTSTLDGDESSPPAELEEGPSVPLAVVQRLICSGAVRLRGVDAEGRPVDLGYKRRTISPALRRALRKRDRHCRFPGCPRQAHLHGHHLEHWPHGPTDLANLAALCRHHHRKVHEGGYGLSVEADGTLHFTKPDGTHIPNTPASTAVEPDHIDQVFADAGITIEPATSDTHWGAGETMDYDHALTAIWYRNHPHNPS